MATKEGAQRACANKRPVIDGRRANVDLAYLGAKPKNPKVAPQQDGAVSPKSDSVPSSPTNSEQDFRLEHGTELVVEEKYPSYSGSPSFPGGLAYDSIHSATAHTVSAQPMISTCSLKPARVGGMQAVSPSQPPVNAMNHYNQSCSLSRYDKNTFSQKYLANQNSVAMVTYMPQAGAVVALPESLAFPSQFNPPQFAQVQVPHHPTKPIPGPAYVYSVPVWYVDQGVQTCGQISVDAGLSYPQTPLVQAGMIGNTSCGIQAGKFCSTPIAYY